MDHSDNYRRSKASRVIDSHDLEKLAAPAPSEVEDAGHGTNVVDRSNLTDQEDPPRYYPPPMMISDSDFRMFAEGLRFDDTMFNDDVSSSIVRDVEREQHQEEEEGEVQYQGGEKITEEKEERTLFEGKSPHQRASWCSRTFFFWINPMIRFTMKHDSIKLENYGDLSEKNKVVHQIDRLDKAWQARVAKGPTKNSLMKTIFSVYKWELMYLIFCQTMSVCMQFMQPFFLSYLIKFIKDGQNKAAKWDIHFYDFQEVNGMEWLTEERQYGLSLGFLLLISQLIKFIIDENLTFGANMFAGRASNSIIGLIYEKQTKIYPFNGDGFTSGQVINFVQTDANKLYAIGSWFPKMVCMPLILIICIGILIYFLQWSFIPGAIVFALSIRINGGRARKQAKLQAPYMKEVDKRVSLTTEVLHNIKMIKLYAWTQTMKDLINQRRNDEYKVFRQRVNISIVNVALVYFFPSTLSAVCYSTYIGLGNTLSLSVGFVMLNVFEMIRDPINWFPSLLGQCIEFMISMQRIQNFLLLDEINQSIVDRSGADASQAQTSDESFSIKSGSNFYWGLKKLEDEEDSKDKKGDKKDKKDDKKDNKDAKLEQKKDGKQPLLSVEDKKEQENDTPSKKSENSSPSKRSEKEQLTVSDVVCLKDIELKVKKGEFVCIIGDVGSGKSSLLSAILGDLKYLDSDFVESFAESSTIEQNIRDKMKVISEMQQTDAPIKINESMSYVQQTPWIQNKTIRQNIVFGEEFDEERYNNTIKICELTRDLEILPAGDKTEIGEKGINLSGGQKARVSLARAVYSEKDLVLMDDPISALDANVKKSIFEKVMLGHLKNKTRVLVTHAIDFLSLVDRVIVMKRGKIVLQGSFDHIKNDPYLLELLKIHKSHQTEQKEVKNAAKSKKVDGKAQDDKELNTKIQDDDEDTELPTQEDQKSDDGNGDEKKAKVDDSKKGKIMTDEQDEKISVTMASYKNWIFKFYGGWCFLFCSITSMTLFMLCQMSSNYMVGNWALQPDQLSNFWFYCILSFTFAIAQGVAVLWRSATFLLFGYYAFKKLHEIMIQKVLQAPVNLYFDTTPIGRILNKFSKDLNQVEQGFGFLFGALYYFIFCIIYAVTIAVAAIPGIAFILPVIVALSINIINRAKRAIKESVRLTSTTKSPLISYLEETISGSSTIRAYNKSDQFVEGNKKFLDQNILAVLYQSGVQAWFGIRADLLALFIMTSFTIVVVLGRRDDGSNAIILSMLMTSILTIQFNVMLLLKLYMWLENQMVNVVRCMKLIDVPQERELPDQKGVSKLLEGRDNWPENGEMEFKNVSLRYRPDTEVVLNKLSFNIKSGEKIGVVGRTGAGKSTITLAITRIVEIFEGQIKIDGVDIGQIKLDDLRSRITVIPQDPTMFKGTLRFNLDPMEQHTDEEILKIINEAQLQDLVDNDPAGIEMSIEENGSNLSSGERQLICICRAILRQSKLVILDEATANIDVITEQKIQALINTQFANSTMVVIAHRINTIIQSDRVLVLSFGEIQEYDSPQNLMADGDSEFSKLISELKKKEEKS